MNRRGFVLTNAALEMETNYDFFCQGLALLTEYQVDAVEFYTDLKNVARYAKAAADHGLTPVYLTAIAQKRSGTCQLCATEESVRAASVEFTKESVSRAMDAGISWTLIQSGPMPADVAREGDALDALARSLEELSQFAGDRITMNLEPCDRSVDVRQLLGPTMETYTFMSRLNLPYDNVKLTMDVAHITELFEDPLTAIALCKPYCRHIHLANCVLKHGAALFGDKHPPYGAEDSCYTSEQARDMFQKIEQMYADTPFLASLEMIHQGLRTLDYVEAVLQSAPWFYRKR